MRIGVKADAYRRKIVKRGFISQNIIFKSHNSLAHWIEWNYTHSQLICHHQRRHLFLHPITMCLNICDINVLQCKVAAVRPAILWSKANPSGTRLERTNTLTLAVRFVFSFSSRFNHFHKTLGEPFWPDQMATLICPSRISWSIRIRLATAAELKRVTMIETAYANFLVDNGSIRIIVCFPSMPHKKFKPNSSQAVNVIPSPLALKVA